MSATVKDYFRLIRIPNVFTTISNILLGYIFFTSIDHFNYFDIFKLISISAFLYIGGMVLNDYFDIKIDKKERPWRPLPSNKISKKKCFNYNGYIFFILYNYFGYYRMVYIYNYSSYGHFNFLV